MYRVLSCLFSKWVLARCGRKTNKQTNKHAYGKNNVAINKNKSNSRFYFTSFYVCRLGGYMSVLNWRPNICRGTELWQVALVQHGLRAIPFAASSSFRRPRCTATSSGWIQTRHRRLHCEGAADRDRGKWREDSGRSAGASAGSSARQSRSKCVNSKVCLFIMKSDGLLMHTSCF